MREFYTAVFLPAGAGAVLPDVIHATATVSGNVTAKKRITPGGNINATCSVGAIVGKIRPIVPITINATSTASGALQIVAVKFIVPANINATSTVSGKVLIVFRSYGFIGKQRFYIRATVDKRYVPEPERRFRIRRVYSTHDLISQRD